MREVVLVIGTRPEGIKMMPVYFALKKLGLPVVICSTTQHRNMLSEVYNLFGVTPDIELNIMRPGQDIFYITQEVLAKTRAVFDSINPRLILVHGDTTSTFAASLAAYYLKIPIGHVEAGLRTHDLFNPFPEEMNRKCVDVLAQYHFAPTKNAASHLIREGVANSSIFLTGNTIVDALDYMNNKISSNEIEVDASIKEIITQARTTSQKIILLSAHRRESFDGGIERILNAIKTFALHNPDVTILYPHHPNPHIQDVINQVKLEVRPNIVLLKPLPYKDLVYTLLHADLVVTDSGGIQEEALSLGKQVIILREKTERTEGIEAGLATLAGTEGAKIISLLEEKIKQTSHHTTHTQLYGDGTAANQIASIIQHHIFDIPAVHREKRI